MLFIQNLKLLFDRFWLLLAARPLPSGIQQLWVAPIVGSYPAMDNLSPLYSLIYVDAVKPSLLAVDPYCPWIRVCTSQRQLMLNLAPYPTILELY